MEYAKISWPFPRSGLHTFQAPSHIPPEGLQECRNFYYPAPNKLRSRGVFDRLYGANGDTQCMYYWDEDDHLWSGTTSGLFRNAGHVIGSTNVTDIVGWGSDNPQLVVCDDSGAGATLYRWDPDDPNPYQVIPGANVPEARRIMVRKDRLFAMDIRGYPHRVAYCEANDYSTWTDAHGQAGWFEVAPGEDGELRDWVDHDGVLYLFKERAIHRLTGDEPRLYMRSRVEGADGVIARTAASCGNVVLYATQTGIYPIGKSQIGMPRSFCLNIEDSLLPYIEDAQATYSEELNCYILCLGRHEFYVANFSMRPDVWTHWEYNRNYACRFVYARSGLWARIGNAVYEYDPDGTSEGGWDLELEIKTGSWNLDDPLHPKNIRFVEGQFDTANNANIRVRLRADNPGGIGYTYGETVDDDARNLVKCNINCEEFEVELVYQDQTGIVEFGGIDLRVRQLSDIK